MQPVETDRLIIREFHQPDAEVIYRNVDEQLGWGAANPEDRWIHGQESYHRHQDLGFDLGEKAAGLRSSDEIIGVCGVYSRIDVFGQFPALAQSDAHLSSDLKSVELGPGFSLDPAHRGNG